MFTKTVRMAVGPTAAEPPRRPSLVAVAPSLALGWCWAHRWPLAPAAATLLVLACGSADPFATCLALLVGAAAFGAWAWAGAGREEVRHLSVRERHLASAWLVAAAVWTTAAAVVPGAPPALAALALALAVAVPSVKWARSRVTRSLLSPEAVFVADRWDSEVAVLGPDVLRRSTVVDDTWEEPAPGAHVFEVRLPAGGHGKTAACPEVARGIEARLGLPVDTVTLSPVREDSGALQVTIAAGRHLETAPVAWPGPEVRGDGAISIAAGLDGRAVWMPTRTDSGVHHAVITGTSGGGKSSATAVVLLGMAELGAVLWLADGKGGVSSAYLRPACDWFATRPDGWAAMIEATHALLVGRNQRRGELGLTEWTRSEVDPHVVLVVDEAKAVGRAVSRRHHDMVSEIAEQGRAAGVSLIQVAQDPAADAFLGGRAVRDLMGGNGTVVALRPGGSMAARLALDATGASTIDLRDLPPEPGFAAIVHCGDVVAMPARVRFASPAAAGEVARAAPPRALAGADAVDAGRAYAARHDSPVTVLADGAVTISAPAEIASAPVLIKPTAAGLPALERVRQALSDRPGGATRAQLIEATSLSPATVSRQLSTLQSAGAAIKAGQVWSLAFAQVSA